MDWARLHEQPYVHMSWMAVVASSVVLYVFVNVKLHANRHRDPFDSSFFRIWRHMACADVLVTVQSWVFIKYLYNRDLLPMGAHEWARESLPRTYMTFTVSGLFYFMPIQMFGVAILTFNRFTSVVLPLKHNMFWRNRNTSMILVSMWTIPLVQPILYAYVLYNNYDDVKSMANLARRTLSVFAGISSLFCVLVVIVLNGWIIVQLCVAKTARKSAELKLTLQTMVIGLLLVAYFMVTIMIILAIKSGAPLWFFAGDLLALVNPYLLLLTSTAVRRLVFSDKQHQAAPSTLRTHMTITKL